MSARKRLLIGVLSFAAIAVGIFQVYLSLTHRGPDAMPAITEPMSLGPASARSTLPVATKTVVSEPAPIVPAPTAPTLHLPHGLRPVASIMEADVRLNGMPPSGSPQAVIDDGRLARCLRHPIASDEAPDRRMRRCAADMAKNRP